MTLIGVDIGGSHISAAQVRWEGDNAEFGTVYEADVDTFKNANDIISAWASVISKACANHTDCKIGIAMPGPFDYSEGISLVKDQGKMKALFGLSVKKLLAKNLQISIDTIQFTNDAESFLAGESLAGEGRLFDNSIGLTLGTGLGSAIKIHDVIKDAKLWTAPFRGGISEDFLGNEWFKKAAFEKIGRNISGVKDLLAPEFDQAVSELIFEDFGKNLGEFLSFYIVRLQCQGVVIGGKISRAADRFLPFTTTYLEKSGYPIAIKITKLEEKATLIGACHKFLI